MIPIAVLICVFQIVALADDIRTRGQAVLRSLRFWCQAAAFVGTVVFFLIGYSGQKATSERLGSDLAAILNTQKSEFNNQAQKLETALQQQDLALKQLDLSLDQAKTLAQNQQKQTEALDQQQENLREVIVSQAGELKLLSRLLNRNLAGIQISYTPSPQKWSEIAAAYSKIRSKQENLQYVDAPMIAENNGDYWKIDFEPVEVSDVQPNGQRMKAGMKKFVKLTTKENPLFEEVLQKALFALRIRWGNGSSTVVDPDQKYYPSAMYVSRGEIRIILRPPFVVWNLSEISENAEIMFFGPNDPPENFRIRSLDPGVVLEETIQLNWSTRPWSRPPTYDETRYRKCSGPHTLFVQFDEFDPGSGKRHLRRANKRKKAFVPCVAINS